MTPEQLLAQHLETQHACCWVVQSRAGAVQCGLYCGHDGEHLDYPPGEYLPPPLLHPLEVLRLSVLAPWRPWWLIDCPVCGQRQRSWNVWCEGPYLVGRWDFGSVSGWRTEKEAWWHFDVCGCQARELAW